MRTNASSSKTTVIEATVTSKGQVTLPKALRSHLGPSTGSRIRFSLQPKGGFKGEPVKLELEDVWKRADKSNYFR